MSNMNRRDFIKQSAGVMAGAWAASHAAGTAAAAQAPAATRLVPLGNTGVKVSLLGMGTGTNGWGGSSDQTRLGHKRINRLLNWGFEQGIVYFDLADQYGSHDNIKRTLKDGPIPREKVTLLTKTVSRDAEGVKKDLDRFRKEADTGYFDIVLLHCLTSADWAEKMQPAMDVLAEAKEKGIVRAHGVSCHDLGALKTAAKTPWVDVMLSRINPFGVRMDGKPEAVAPVLEEAHKNGKGMIGMKIAGGGATTDRIPKSLNYVLNLGCIDAITMGFTDGGELEHAVKHIDQAVATA